MICHQVKILVSKGMTTKVARAAYCHEIPILMLKFGETGIEIEGPLPDAARDLDPVEEYDRLADKYKHEDDGLLSVAKVYGQPFEDKLEKAMARGLELVGLKNPKKPRKKKSVKRTVPTEPDGVPYGTGGAEAPEDAQATEE